MLAVEVIDDPAAAVVALDPARSRLLSELAEPASAATLAGPLGIARQKINYHLRTLEEHQLVRVAEERAWGGLTERLMVATASSYIVSPVAMGAVAADVAVGETGGGAAALLEFLLAGGGAGFDEDVADAELLDEAEGFLAGAGADGEHADDAADAEDDAEGGEQGAGLLGAEVGAGLADVGEKDHWGAPGGEKAVALRAAGKLKHAPPLRRAAGKLKHAPPLRRRKTRVIGKGLSWRRSVEWRRF